MPPKTTRALRAPTQRRLDGLIAGRLSARCGWPALLALVLFLLLAQITRSDNPLTRLDFALHSQLTSHAEHTPHLASLFRVLSHFGDLGTLVLVIAGVASALFALSRKTRQHYPLLVFWIVGGAGAGVLNQCLKFMFHRPRPDQDAALTPATGFSFPSGHSMGSFILFGMGAYLLLRLGICRQWRLLYGFGAGLLMLLIGFSRVYLGAHWPTDVLGGWLAGATWLALCISVAEAYRSAEPTPRKQAPPTSLHVCRRTLGLTKSVSGRRVPWRSGM